MSATDEFVVAAGVEGRSVAGGPPDCPFCAAGIHHLWHVPSASVVVGQDYGEAG